MVGDVADGIDGLLRGTCLLYTSCSAQHCMYQKNGSCTAGMISVCGSGASRKDETECASFRLS